MTKMIWPSVASLVALAAALFLRAIVLTALRRWGAREGGGVLAAAIRLPSLLWCFVIAFYFGVDAATDVAGFPVRFRHELSMALQAAVILSVTFTAAEVIGTLIAHAGRRQSLEGAVTGLAQSVARSVVIVVGLLTLALHLGIHIMPIITALGVGGLAVALALKDTLANLFSGVHLLADRPIRVGDYVKIGGSDAIEGYVVDVGWRTTRLRMLDHCVVIVPNQTVANSTIINYDLPEPPLRIDIRVGVGYAQDPVRIESLLVDVATTAVDEVPGLRAEPAPWVWFLPGFGASSLDFTLYCYVGKFYDQFSVQDELRKRIIVRFRAEGVDMPYPIQTVQLQSHIELGGAGRIPQPPLSG